MRAEPPSSATPSLPWATPKTKSRPGPQGPLAVVCLRVNSFDAAEHSRTCIANSPESGQAPRFPTLIIPLSAELRKAKVPPECHRGRRIREFLSAFSSQCLPVSRRTSFVAALILRELPTSQEEIKRSATPNYSGDRANRRPQHATEIRNHLEAPKTRFQTPHSPQCLPSMMRC